MHIRIALARLSVARSNCQRSDTEIIRNLDLIASRSAQLFGITASNEFLEIADGIKVACFALRSTDPTSREGLHIRETLMHALRELSAALGDLSKASNETSSNLVTASNQLNQVN